MSHETLIKDPQYLGEEGLKRLTEMGIVVKDIHIKEWKMVDGVNQLVIKQTHRYKQPKRT